MKDVKLKLINATLGTDEKPLPEAAMVRVSVELLEAAIMEMDALEAKLDRQRMELVTVNYNTYGGERR